MEGVKNHNQIWASENLAIDCYANGDKIPCASNAEEWRTYSVNKVGCYCYYDYNEQNKKFGKLYNFYAINDHRGIAPKGWRVPSDKDWQILVDNLGGSLIAGKSLKSDKFISYEISDKCHQNSLSTTENGHLVHSYKFNFLPSGYHGGSSSQLLGFNAHFWTSTEYLDDYAWLRFLTYENDFVGRSFDYKSSGFVVRLIKENLTEFVEIGNQKWSKRNLDVVKFANGDSIPVARNSEELIYFSNGKVPCCCAYNFDENLVSQYGRLYNYWAVNDPRYLINSEKGHIPTDKEWTELVCFLGGENNAGERLKVLGNDMWAGNNFAKDEFGFSAKPAGYFGDGYFATLGHNAVFWSSSEYKGKYAWLRLLSYNSPNLDRGFDYKKGGYSVRYLSHE